MFNGLVTTSRFISFSSLKELEYVKALYVKARFHLLFIAEIIHVPYAKTGKLTAQFARTSVWKWILSCHFNYLTIIPWAFDIYRLLHRKCALRIFIQELQNSGIIVFTKTPSWYRKMEAVWSSGIGRWISNSSNIALSGFVLVTPEFNLSDALCKQPNGQPPTSWIRNNLRFLK